VCRGRGKIFLARHSPCKETGRKEPGANTCGRKGDSLRVVPCLPPQGRGVPRAFPSHRECGSVRSLAAPQCCPPLHSCWPWSVQPGTGLSYTHPAMSHTAWLHDLVQTEVFFFPSFPFFALDCGALVVAWCHSPRAKAKCRTIVGCGDSPRPDGSICPVRILVPKKLQTRRVSACALLAGNPYHG